MQPTWKISQGLILPTVLAVLFGLGTWAGGQLKSWPVRFVGAAAGLALAVVLVRAIQRRQTVARSTPRRLLRLGLFSLIVIVIAVPIMALQLMYTRAMFFVHPDRNAVLPAPESVGISDYQTISFVTEDGLTLRGWYIPSKNGAVVVYMNGHAGNRGGLLFQAAKLSKMGYGALLYDTRNTGLSDGTMTTMGYYEARDVTAAVRYAQSQPGVDAEQIALYGQSMGASGAMLALPQLPEVKGVVIECSFSALGENISAAVSSLGLPAYPFGNIVAYFGQRETGVDIYNIRPADALADFRGPVLIIHGNRDDLLPVRNAYALYEAAREPKTLYIVQQGGHCGFEAVDPQGLEKQITTFIKTVFE